MIFLENPIHNFTHTDLFIDAGLREKLNKIMASDYFTTTPEIKAPVEVAAAAGNYTFQVPVHVSMIPQVSMPVSVEGSGAEFAEFQQQVKLAPYPYKCVGH